MRAPVEGAPVRIAAFALVLVVVLAAGFGVGRLVGPLDDDAPGPADHSESGDHAAVLR